MKNIAKFKYQHFDKFIINYDFSKLNKRTNELLNNSFTFDKPWDMERCTTLYTLKNIDWNEIKNDDEEWTFMLNRMDFVNDLSIMYLKTKNKIYLNKIKYFINDFIEKHQIIKPELSTRTLDTAIRLLNWLNAIIILKLENHISNKEEQIIIENIQKQLLYLKNNYIDKYKTSNWGTIQTVCILIFSMFLYKNYQDTDLYKFAKKEFEININSQIYPDGGFIEQSIMYHVEVLNYCMLLLYYLEYFKNNLYKKYSKKIENLAWALFYQLTPNNTIEAFGDSDRVDATDVFIKASLIFNNNYFKIDNTIDLDTLFLFGTNYCKKFQNLKTKYPKKLFYDGSFSGIHTIKSSFNKNASFTMFLNTSLGSSHGHCDNLHISLCHKGEFILIDSGRYSYKEIPERTYLKSMFAHNIVTLNNTPFNIPLSSWEYENFGTILKTYSKHIKNYHYLEGGIIGNNPLQVFVRKLLIIDPSIWIIVDEIKADGNNFANLNLHIDSQQNIYQENNNIVIQGINSKLKLINDEIYTIKQEFFSPCYNTLLKTNVIKYTKNFKNHTNIITYIVDYNIDVQNIPLYQSNKLIDNDIAFSKKFIINKNETISIGIFHKEIYKGRKNCSLSDITFCGKCIIVHEKNGKKTYTIMRA